MPLTLLTNNRLSSPTMHGDEQHWVDDAISQTQMAQAVRMGLSNRTVCQERVSGKTQRNPIERRYCTRQAKNRIAAKTEYQNRSMKNGAVKNPERET